MDKHLEQGLARVEIDTSKGWNVVARNGKLVIVWSLEVNSHGH